MPFWTLKRNKKFNNSKKMRGERRALCFKTVPNQQGSKAHCVRIALLLLGLHRGTALSQLPHLSLHRYPGLEENFMSPYRCVASLGSRQGHRLAELAGCGLYPASQCALCTEVAAQTAQGRRTYEHTGSLAGGE